MHSASGVQDYVCYNDPDWAVCIFKYDPDVHLEYIYSSGLLMVQDHGSQVYMVQDGPGAWPLVEAKSQNSSAR